MSENAIETIRLLIVSREPSVLRPLWSIGETNSWQLETAGSGWEALERLQSGAAPHVLLLDVPRGDADSLHVIRWLRRIRPDLPILVISYPNGLAQEKEAIRLGAKDYLVRPLDEAQLEAAIRRQLGGVHDASWLEPASDEIEPLDDGAYFVGMSPIMQKVREQARLLAEADVPVLLVGEPGTGKETVARLIHKFSVRSGCKFVKVNCGALPAALLEGELFGAEGKASGMAMTRKAGKLELCGKGTIVLEEIAEMPEELQIKLLKVLQEKTFVRPGSESSVSVDVRILATAGSSLDRALAERKIREDLYYRLSTFTLLVPPLRQRKEEIPILLQHFMHLLAKQYGIASRSFSAAVIDACQAYTWPGNLNELEEFVKRYLLMGDSEISFGAQDELEVRGTYGHGKGTPLNDGAQGAAGETGSLKSMVQTVKLEAERNAIAAALEKTGWNRKAAARLLKVSYRTILYKIDQYHMKSPEGSSSPLQGSRSEEKLLVAEWQKARAGDSGR